MYYNCKYAKSASGLSWTLYYQPHLVNYVHLHLLLLVSLCRGKQTLRYFTAHIIKINLESSLEQGKDLQIVASPSELESMLFILIDCVFFNRWLSLRLETKLLVWLTEANSIMSRLPSWKPYVIPPLSQWVCHTQQWQTQPWRDMTSQKELR